MHSFYTIRAEDGILIPNAWRAIPCFSDLLISSTCFFSSILVQVGSRVSGLAVTDTTAHVHTKSAALTSSIDKVGQMPHVSSECDPTGSPHTHTHICDISYLVRGYRLSVLFFCSIQDHQVKESRLAS